MASPLRAFDTRILVYDPYLSQQQLGDLGRLVDLPELLKASDFVSIHCALTAETHGIIGRRELNLMKPTAYLINTARAAVVDEEALLEALKGGKIAGAALDVFWQEPLPEDSPFLKLDNVILTPHLGGASDDVKEHQSAVIVEGLQSFLEGRPPAWIINPDVLA